MTKIYNRFLIILLGLPIFVIAQSHYIPEDLQKFLDTNQCENCDLSNISIINFADHANAKLHGTILDNIDTLYLKLNMADLSSTICINGILTGVSAPNANFNNANLYNTTINGANLSHASFINTQFIKANLNSSFLESSDFTGAIFTGADLDNADFKHANVTLSQLTKAASMNHTTLPDGTICKNKQACIPSFYLRHNKE